MAHLISRQILLSSFKCSLFHALALLLLSYIVADPCTHTTAFFPYSKLNSQALSHAKPSRNWNTFLSIAPCCSEAFLKKQLPVTYKHSWLTPVLNSLALFYQIFSISLFLVSIRPSKLNIKVTFRWTRKTRWLQVKTEHQSPQNQLAYWGNNQFQLFPSTLMSKYEKAPVPTER